MIILDKHRDTLKKLNERFGTKEQLDMLVEKMGILTTKIHRYNRKINKAKNEDDRKKLQSECEEAMAHVLVLMEQVGYSFDESNIGRFAEQKITKTKEKLSF